MSMQHPHWLGFARTAVAVAVVAATAPALAQNTTSALNGRVAGPDGTGIAGVTVTIVHTESGSTVTTTTNADGRYAARGLRVGGPYTVTYSKDGDSEKKEGVFLALAETLALDATLGQTQTITVTGSSLAERFNRGNMGAGTSIGSRELAAQASIGRNLQDYARTDPRLSQTDKERGEISAAGQNPRFNSITIDGVAINDTFGLKANNLPTLKQPISIDAIQAVQVNISNVDVTQKGYTGANINAVTKSGTNELKGTLSYVFRRDEWTGERFNRTNGSYAPAPAFYEYLTGFTLGGPIVKDKLFFFVGYEELKSARGAPEFGPVGDSKTNVAITPAAIDGATTIARDVYGQDIGTVAARGPQTIVKDTLLKLDWNISDQHRASVRYTKTDQTDPSFNNISATALSFSSNWHDQKDVIETVVAQWFADWTDAFSTELKVSRREYESVPSYLGRSPQVGLNFTGALPAGVSATTPNNRTLFLGTERSRHFNELRTKTNDLYASANWNLGEHELKGGIDVSKNEVFNAFLQDTFGNYTFRCINETATFQYAFTPAGSDINCGTANAAQVEAAVLENFQRGRPVQYQVQVGANGNPVEAGAANWNATQTGLFLQDTWNVNKALTVTAGVRVDQHSVGDKPIANPNAAGAVIAGNPSTNTRQTGGFGYDNTETIDGDRLVQPRLGFNWNFGSADTRRMQLRGGIGLFQGAAANVWLSNPYSNTGMATRVIGCGGSFAACPTTDGFYSADPDNQPVPAGSSPAANVDFIDPSLSQPSVWKTNLAFETELPWGGIVAGAEWLRTKVKQGIYYQHLNLGTPVRSGTDGRELYWTASGYNPNCWTATGTQVNNNATCPDFRSRGLSNASYANVLLASGTRKGGGDVFTLSLAGPVRNGLSWTAAYSRMSAKEVSPLTSSVANSNWAARSSFNPNEEVAANSASLVRDRVNASLTWTQAFDGKHKTSVGVFFEGRSGKPYSWTYNNDLNGDGQAGNDLMYIPRGPGSGEVEFRGAGEDAFWNVVNQYDELSGARGGVVQRNSGKSPFVKTFDLRVAQEMPGFFSSHKVTLGLDILNFANLLNRKWGRTDEVAFQSAGGTARSFVNYGGLNASGQYIYNVTTLEDYTTRQARGESQWAAQLTLKYEF